MNAMKLLLVLSVVAAAASQYYGGGGYRRVSFAPVVTRPVLQVQQRPVVISRDPLVDYSGAGSDYHFSWRHDGGRKYAWEAANQYCASLGRGWTGVSIETHEEDRTISSIITGDQLQYIWTGGYRSGYDFVWPSGATFVGLNWSPTGAEGRPQPDNREEGGENCLAVLNNFYNDGVKWHDVGCHHEKPIICERQGSFYG
ncbi:pulmonary surfactant-associated protein D-like [Penaeus japonicus]|uniref:pulmonary surfactant-associated protein D-like n=1 Tax=Penaeus japonicus TaxID=27405 RepID=UPI001C712671|nr:pulmonary surfactant-associated protein D-like [Penaeus japonicus]